LIGSIAGFTFESVCRKIAQTEVAHAETVAAKRP
jgi:hypothetical protein